MADLSRYLSASKQESSDYAPAKVKKSKKKSKSKKPKVKELPSVKIVETDEVVSVAVAPPVGETSGKVPSAPQSDPLATAGPASTSEKPSRPDDDSSESSSDVPRARRYDTDESEDQDAPNAKSAADVSLDSDSDLVIDRNSSTSVSVPTDGNLAPVIRDKATGRRLTAEEAAVKNSRGAEGDKEVLKTYAGGIVQAREKKLREERAKEIGSGKVTQTKEDVDHIVLMKRDEELREEDPMAVFLDREREKKRRKKEKKGKKGKKEKMDTTEDLYGNVKSLGTGKKSSFHWPNRFNIAPGPEWDGIDRSNGWEAERFRTINEQAAERQRRYTSAIDL